jgi:CubicO group peptidase (beta-lactamase class C family)
VRALLAHGGGVVRDGNDGDFWALYRAFPDAETLLAIARDEGKVVPANERFKYSNVGYSLLGMVIEAVTGQSYGAVTRAQVIDRLGLTHTAPDHDPDLGTYASGHSALAYADERVTVEHVGTGAMAPATGFVSTAENLVRYVAAHLPGDDRLLGDDAKRVMQRTEWRVDGPGPDPLAEYSLGMMVSHVGKRRLLGHGGGWPGHITRTLLDTETGIAVSVLTNAIDGPAEVLATGLFRLLDLANDSDAPRSGQDLSRYTGRFANLWGVADVADLGGRLLWLNPTSDDPSQAPVDLVVEDEWQLRMSGGNGYGSHGEPLDYTVTDGRVTALRGSSGWTWQPFEPVRAAAERGEPVRLGSPLVG